MSKAGMVYRCIALLRADRRHQGALSSLRRYASSCTLAEYKAHFISEVENDITLLNEMGFSLHEPVSPAVQQCGSVEISQPFTDSSPPVGAGGKKGRRLEGKPLTAKKRRRGKPKAAKPNQPSSDSDSPLGSLDGLF